jgi:hypothetical protein
MARDAARPAGATHRAKLSEPFRSGLAVRDRGADHAWNWLSGKMARADRPHFGKCATRERRRKSDRKGQAAEEGEIDSDETFAFIAGHTEGSAPFGVTGEEWNEDEKYGNSDKSGRREGVSSPQSDDADSLPF